MRNKLLTRKYKIQGSVIEKLSEIRRLYNLSLEENQKEKELKLKKLLLYAYNNTNYYHNILKEYQVVENNKVSLTNYAYLPPLTKDLIRDNYNDLISKEAKSLGSYVNHSGGATGKPVQVLQSKEFSDWSIAVSIFYDELCGYKLGMKKAKLWGAQNDLFVGRKSLKVRAGQWLKNEIWLNAFIVDDNKYIEYLDRLKKFKPYMILAYADSIYELALFIERNNLREVYSP
ncbi:MAG: hypothetical protein R3321_14850, partial [Nitrososphaeraceae archaeon]|nr:hypothetical protein [Nitrososphaeraceae archaeon]